MEQILKNLNDPSWWFTGIFFVLVGLFLTKVLFTWLPSGLKSISNKIPVYQGLLSRRLKLRMLKAVKRNRQHEVRVNWVIAKHWSLITITTMYAFFVLVMFLLYQKPIDAGIRHQLVPSILFIPMYFLQFLAVIDKKIALRVIRAHIQWKRRITKAQERTC